MPGEKTADYEKPAITRHYTGFMNKFGAAAYALPQNKISGVSVRELVKQFGSPLWVVSEEVLRGKYKDLHRALSTRYSKVAIAYSYKTNFLSGICALFHQEGAWAEVASGFEYDIAMKLGVPGHRIVFNGPYKTRAELQMAIEQHSLINIDSYQEIDNLEELAKELDVEVKVGIRVNMQLYDTSWDRFGFNLESGQAIDVCNRISSSESLKLAGLHVHTGTFILDTNIYRALAEKLIGLYNSIKNNPGIKIEYLDVGGGFASKNTLHYQWIPGEYACPTFDEYAEALCSPLVAELSNTADMPQLIVEPGRALNTRLLSDFHIQYKLDKTKEDWLLDSINQAPDIRINRDLAPSGLLYDISLWSALFSERFGSVFELMGKANLRVFLIPLAVFLAVFLALRRRIHKLATASVAIAIVTTGFAGMAFDMVLILSFQSLYGYVFQMVALLIAAFMVGLAIGSIFMTHIMGRVMNNKPLLIKLESLILAYAIVVPVVLVVFHSHMGQSAIFAVVQAVILVLSLVSGVLVGSEFPLANKIYLTGTGRVGEVAGALYACDLIGAWVGALIVSLWLIPVLGIVSTCVLVACLKVVSLILIVTSKL